MRRIIASALVLSQITCATLALAQDVAAPSTGQAETVTTTPRTSTTTTTTAGTTAPTGTTTITQASVDSPSGPIVSTPPPRPAESGGSETTSYVNRPLLVTGLIFLGGTYAASAGVAAESSRASDRPNLYYPIAGPWMDIAQRNCNSAHPCSGETGNLTLLALDGIGQGLGAIALVSSFFVPEKKSRHWFFIGNDHFHAAPAQVGLGGYGLATAGTF